MPGDELRYLCPDLRNMDDRRDRSAAGTTAKRRAIITTRLLLCMGGILPLLRLRAKRSQGRVIPTGSTGLRQYQETQ